MTSLDDATRLTDAAKAWRDSLLLLSGRNRLLNYKPTRSSTLEFVRATADEVVTSVHSSKGVPVIGLLPPKDAVVAPEESTGELEEAALDVIEQIDFADYPDHLFVNKTQRDTERALRNLARTASREYLDRGLSVLYLALGGLRWKEDNGDPRLSPLLFLPVELHADGPKQPHRVHPSPEDLVPNPALAIRLREIGVTLPDQIELDQLFAEGGVAAVEERVRSLPLPEDWVVEPLCVLSTFMFAKEAMYRDLELNESRILESSLIQSLTGEPIDGVFGALTFDPVDPDTIDAVSPPETAPLILDADATQRVAVAAATDGRSFVMDGPPGTGKSQTIANMIAALIANGKRVLFVSEKAVALDVVRDRLAARGLGSLLLELHSHKATRAEVATALGSALANRPVVNDRPDMIASRVQPIREELTAYAAAMNQRRSPMGWTLFDALGQAENLPTSRDLPPFKSDSDWLTPERWERIGDLETALSRLWAQAKHGDSHPWRGLVDADGLEYDIRSARQALDVLLSELDSAAPKREWLGLESLARWPEVVQLMRAWQQAPTTWHSRAWLVDVEAAYLRDHVPAVVQRAKDLLVEDAALTATLGADWQELRRHASIASLTADTWRATGIDPSTMTASDLSAASSVLRQLSVSLRNLDHRSARLADLLGVARPAALHDAERLIASARVVVDSPRLEAAWLERGAGVAMGQAVQRLRDARSAESDIAARARQHFRDSIGDIDVQPYAQRWSSLPSWRKALLGPAGADRQALEPHVTGKPKAAFGGIHDAVDWQHARAEVARAEHQVKELLGYTPVNDDEFAHADTILQRITASAVIAPALNLDALRRAQADPDTWRMVTAALAEVGAALDDARERTLPFAGTPGGDPGRPWPARLADIDLAADAIDRLLSDTEPFRTSVATLPSDAVSNQQAVHKICDALDALRRDIQDIDRTALPGIDATITSEWIDETTSRTEWTLQIREIVASTSPDQTWAALSALAPHASLAAAGADWDSHLAGILTHFEDTARGPMRDRLAYAPAALDQLRVWDDAMDEASAWLMLREALRTVETLGLTAIVDALLRRETPQADVVGALRSAVLAGWVTAVERSDSRLRSTRIISRDELVGQFRELDRQTVEKAAARVLSAAVAKRPAIASSQTALINAEGGKKRRHIPVRDLIGRATDVIQALHPCFMMSPLAVSQYLPPDIEFDVVIFDEASQIPPGDAINCIYRAKAVIAAGDQRQLPPTSFFTTSQADDDEVDGEDDLASDYESLLDLMKSSGGFSSIPLRWHYRSRHEHLIAYSNNSFYEDGLITFPGALAETPDAGVKFFKVDGVYRRSQGQNNPIEANFVAQRIIHHLDHRPGLSIGVVAMSAAQRDAISDALTMLRVERPDLEPHFGEDRAGGIFVKSLEEVQGDERDVIVLSVGYGPDSTGTVYRNFGPINKKGGERRLNVAITRAKELTEVVSSMTAGDIGEVASAGGRHLRRYLDYAERGPIALEMELGSAGLGTDSPFEDSVISAIRSWGYDVQPQVGVSGFRIDIGVKHPNAPGVFMLGVECDGAMYHSSRTARDRDRLRHDILVGLGWKIHHIWGLDWYRHRTREEGRLRERLDETAAAAVVGRVVAPPPAAESIEVTFDNAAPIVLDRNARPSWMAEYVSARTTLAYHDWTDEYNAKYLVSFIEKVVEVESPVHLETVKRRLREHSDIGRVSKNATRTILAAIEMAKIRFDGAFLRTLSGNVTEPRHNGGRSLEEVHDDELRIALARIQSSQVGARDDELVVTVARAFGWNRTPQDLASRIRGLLRTPVTQSL